jgi:hypothetical protein
MKAITVYEAMKLVEDNVRATAIGLRTYERVPSNPLRFRGVYVVGETGEIVKFENEKQMSDLNTGEGFIFSVVYRDGNIDVTPKNF